MEYCRPCGGGQVLGERPERRWELVAGPASRPSRGGLDPERPLERRPHRVAHHRAQASAFELVQRLGRRATRRGHHVAQLGNMLATLEREFGAPLHGVEDELSRHVARKPEVDRRIGERFDEQEDVGRAGAAHGGRHGHLPLIVHLELAPERGEDGSGSSFAGIVDAFSRVPDGDPTADLGGRVGHAAHHRRVIQSLTQSC